MLRRLMLFLMFVLVITACAAPPAEPGPAATEAPATESPALPEPTQAQPTESAPTAAPATQEPTPEPTQPPAAAKPTIAYVGADGNIWLQALGSEEKTQVTQDGTGLMPAPDQTRIDYGELQWSSDGRYLAYEKTVGVPKPDRMDMEWSIEAYDTQTGESKVVLAGVMTAGFSWRPQTHVITYALPTDPNYFIKRGETAAALAKGIWAVDVEAGGEPVELVKPERGITLVRPAWSKDGRFLAFDEIQFMEGRGEFAFYDFEAQKYVSWEKVIGNYDWSPDSETIVYDDMAYTGTGEERIHLADRSGQNERALAPVFENGYSFLPVFSHRGDRVAYQVNQGGPDNQQFELYVQPVSGDGEPTSLGKFENPQPVQWLPEDSGLIFWGGPYEKPQVFVIDLASGTSSVFADGSQPVVQPAQP